MHYSNYFMKKRQTYEMNYFFSAKKKTLKNEALQKLFVLSKTPPFPELIFKIKNEH